MPNLNNQVSPSSIVFIDTKVENYQSLIAGVKPGTEVVVLDGNKDAIDQITEILALRTNIDSIHIVSHGAPGSLQLGNGCLSADNVETYSEKLQQWRSALSVDADILIYGCNVASASGAYPKVRQGMNSLSQSESRLKPTGNNLNKQSLSEDFRYETGVETNGGSDEYAIDDEQARDIDGVAFIQRIAQLTNTNVAASQNLTGSVAKGGDWELEVRTGEIETPLTFEAEVLAGYEYVLNSFGAATNFGAGGQPQFVGVGDFNGDTKPDLAVPNRVANVSILLGTGTGTFSAPTNFPVGQYAFAVTVADFNGDTKLDLAVANWGSNNVSILLGTGTGSFGTATNFNVGSSPWSVTSGDFNGDGNIDLATANIDSNNVSILLGTGTGSFSDPTNFIVGTKPQSVSVGDFNKDGKLDLATANFTSNNVSILLGTGTGSFGTATNFSVGTNPYSVAVQDFNGDANPDIATANEGSNNVSVLLGNGTGGFGTNTNFAVGTGPRSVTVGDFNADGKIDLATANGVSSSTPVANNLSVLLGTGTGTFSPVANYSLGSNPWTVTAADLNADGNLDLATSNYWTNDVSILLNTTPAVNFGAATYSGSEGTADTVVNIPVTISATPDAAVTVPIVIDPSSSATENSDYTFSPTSITFPAGATGDALTQNVAFTIKPDNIVENAETAILNFGTITGGVAGTTKQTTLTIAANGQPSSLSPYQIDLKTGAITGGPNPFISLVNTPTDSNADSWLEAVAKINFDGKIKKAKFIVEYDKTPSGWTVNLGDSASNDGYGGDASTNSRDAEMQIVNGGMAVFGNDYNTPAGGELTPGNVPNFVSNGSRVELEVSNEQLAWDNKSGLKNSLNSPYLYALNGQPDATGPVNSEIYAGFNRVISGPGDRIGSGASKVTILLNPIDYAISAGVATVTEGNSGTTAATFTVTRSGCTDLASTVDYAIAGTATNASDYNNIGGTSGATAATGTINFAAGETSKTITLDVLGDSAIEANETLEVTLSNPSVLDSTPTITTATATTTITNDDVAPPTPTPTPTPVTPTPTPVTPTPTPTPVTPTPTPVTPTPTPTPVTPTPTPVTPTPTPVTPTPTPVTPTPTPTPVTPTPTPVTPTPTPTPVTPTPTPVTPTPTPVTPTPTPTPVTPTPTPTPVTPTPTPTPVTPTPTPTPVTPTPTPTTGTPTPTPTTGTPTPTPTTGTPTPTPTTGTPTPTPTTGTPTPTPTTGTPTPTPTTGTPTPTPTTGTPTPTPTTGTPTPTPTTGTPTPTPTTGTPTPTPTTGTPTPTPTPILGSPGIVISPASGLVTTEAGGTDQFTIKLNRQPTADVTIGLRSSNEAEGVISTESITFNSANWNQWQPVTVTGVNDRVFDGDKTYQIVTAPAVSADSNYNGLNAPDATVVNRGNTIPPSNDLIAGGPRNDQILSIPTVNFSPATYQVNESRTVTVQKQITLTRTGDQSNFSTVWLERPTGSATLGIDWNVPPNFSPQITFNPGENSKTLTIDILPDGQFEGTEEIAFRIANGGVNVNIGTQNTATLQIFDAEGPPTINFSPATYQVNESRTGIVQKQITLTRTGGNIDSFSRVYLEPPTGSATFGTDWNTPNFFPEITFNPGEKTKTFTIDVFPDAQVEGTEEIAFRITNRDNSIIGTQNTASLKIIDAESTLNNNPPVVTNPLLNQRGPNPRRDFSVTLAPNTFTDPDPGDSLTYSYSIIPEPDPNGPFGPNRLDWLTFDPNTGTFIAPDWLTFDPNTLTFSVNLNAGNVPSFFYVPIKVTATDNAGASVSDFFHLYRADSLSGVAIDGYISGATVFLDANKNGILDANEPSTTTNSSGEFNLDIPFETFDTNKNGEIDPSEGNLVAIGGIDTATGLPLETPVTAPPDASVVTLLTSLIADLIDKGIEPEEAQSLVKAALSLPAEVDLTSLDPILATNNNQPGGVQVLAAMVKVQNFITQTSGLIDGASSAVNTDIVKAVVSSITAQIQSGTVLNLSNAAALEPIIQQTAAKIQQIDPSFNSQTVSQITSQSATVMATANQRIDAAVSNPTGTSIPESLARLQQVALGPTTQDFKSVGTGNKPISQLVADNTGTALDSRIEAVVLPVGIATPVVSGDADLGSNSPDAILGTNGDDILTGDSGNNVLMGMRGNDSLDGVLGNDTIFGGKGSDTILGSSGDDVLFGNRGADILNGDDGNDILYGGKGDDLLNGGLGSDTLVGGMGVDKFLLSTNSGTDTITDFEVGQDLLVLGSGLSFSQLAIAQDSGATLIRLAQTGEILASLAGVSATSISAVNFGLI
ncbi:DUF4347 domain-containing protein [Microcoleus sp. T2B6]|uniref:DUF4347 domain-containing protein n=1 Tax=Microcoleus sp. T2B6 TaxID=3055424 RepID=UPI002FD5755E